jgi:hypothetical protein
MQKYEKGVLVIISTINFTNPMENNANFVG